MSGVARFSRRRPMEGYIEFQRRHPNLSRVVPPSPRAWPWARRWLLRNKELADFEISDFELRILNFPGEASAFGNPDLESTMRKKTTVSKSARSRWAVAITAARGMSRRKPGGPSFAERMAKSKAADRALEDAPWNSRPAHADHWIVRVQSWATGMARMETRTPASV